MATKNPTRAKPARRASQRVVFSINLASEALRNLMTEQCRSDAGYVTAYRGSRADLTAAGVPAEAFPANGATTDFQLQTLNVCCTGRRELLQGVLRSDDVGYELEVDWGHVRPYVQGAHPAICELARMLSICVSDWTTTTPWSNKPDLAQPIDMVAADPRSEYKPAADAPRLQVSPEFHKELGAFSCNIYEFVHTRGEVLPCAGKPSITADDTHKLAVIQGGMQ